MLCVNVLEPGEELGEAAKAAAGWKGSEKERRINTLAGTLQAASGTLTHSRPVR